MRRNIASTFLALSLGIFVLCPSFFLAQQQSEANRKVVSRVDPVYPELARRIQITGIVRVEATVAPKGTVKSIQVVGGSPVLARAAVDAIEKWKWAVSPVETKELIELNFHPE